MKIKDIFVVTNDKGGVGKTTTAVNLAYGLKEENYRVLLIDMDSQRYASFCCGWSAERDAEASVFDTLSKEADLPVYRSEDGIYFTPASHSMAQVDVYLRQNFTPTEVLRDAFTRPVDDRTGEGLTMLAEDFDYIVIDCPPALGLSTLNAMAVGTSLIIPVQMEGFAVRGVGNVMECYQQVRKKLNPGLTIRGFLFVMVNPRLRLTKKYIAAFNENFHECIFSRYIRRDQKVPESQDNFGCVLKTDPYCNAAMDYKAWIRELSSDRGSVAPTEEPDGSTEG